MRAVIIFQYIPVIIMHYIIIILQLKKTNILPCSITTTLQSSLGVSEARNAIIIINNMQ